MFKIVIIFIYLVHTCSSARILGIFPLPSISHQVVFEAITEELARRGHDVTVIAPHKVTDAPNNLNQIDTSDVAYKIFSKLDLTKMGLTSKSLGETIESFEQFIPIVNEVFIGEMSDPRVNQVLNTSQFDLVMVETTMIQGYAAAYKFRTPLVSICTFIPEPLVYSVLGAPTHPFLYNMYNLNVDTSTIIGKVKTLYYYLYFNMIYSWKIKTNADLTIKTIFGDDSPSSIDLMKDVDLLLVNSHPIVTGFRPTVSTIVNINGIHMKEKKPLPEDLKKYLDESKQGVIYMSFGTNVKSKNLPKEMLNVFLDVFKALPYNVLWKYEDNNLNDIPKNIKIQKWLPQNDLLNHQNVKAFITQGGLQSIDEAILNEVPLIGIPFIGDQGYNVRRIKELNIGIELNVHRINSEILRQAILEVVNNDSYKNNITQLSKYIKDEQTPALDRAIWWIEYVIRHGGTKHLADPSTKINVFEYLMLDLLTAAIVSLAFIYFVIRLVIKNCMCKKFKLKTA